MIYASSTLDGSIRIPEKLNLAYNDNELVEKEIKYQDILQPDKFFDAGKKMMDKRPPYDFSDVELVRAVRMSVVLGRPLLLQGEPGCGKTTLAYAIAYFLGLPIQRFSVKSTSQGRDLLYTYDAVNRLYDTERKSPDAIDIKNYIRFRPLGWAIARAANNPGQRSVVLIDEIDKAGPDFANDLLWEIDQLEFRIDEPGGDALHYQVPPEKSELRPLIFITHNGERSLPDAFMRRCLYYYIHDQMLRILKLHHQEPSQANLHEKAVRAVEELRSGPKLNKQPGVSELIDWLCYLDHAKEKLEFPLKHLPAMPGLIKDHKDQQVVKTYLEKK